MLNIPPKWKDSPGKGTPQLLSPSMLSWASEMSPWMTVRMQGSCIQSSSGRTQSLNNRPTRQAVCSDPRLMVNTVEGLTAERSVEAFPALVLPFVVEYDPNNDGKYGKHQGEKDDKEESQATQGRWRDCH